MFFLAKHFTIPQAALDAPAAPDLNGRKLTALDEVINGGQRNPEVLRSLFDRHKFGRCGIGHKECGW